LTNFSSSSFRICNGSDCPLFFSFFIGDKKRDLQRSPEILQRSSRDAQRFLEIPKKREEETK